MGKRSDGDNQIRQISHPSVWEKVIQLFSSKSYQTSAPSAGVSAHLEMQRRDFTSAEGVPGASDGLQSLDDKKKFCFSCTFPNTRKSKVRLKWSYPHWESYEDLLLHLLKSVTLKESTPCRHKVSAVHNPNTNCFSQASSSFKSNCTINKQTLLHFLKVSLK